MPKHSNKMAAHLATPIADSLEKSAEAYAPEDAKHWRCKAAALAIRTVTNPTLTDDVITEAYDLGCEEAREHGCWTDWTEGWGVGMRIVQ